jgi:hypothetical protein
MEILSPDAFAARVREYGNKQVQLIAKKAGLAVFEEVFRNLLILTPVLTGHARYNWQPSIGNPVTEEQDGIAGVESTGAALTGEELGDIEAMKKLFLTSPAWGMFITNNVPYIQILDNGNSAKAPTGMTEPAIAASLAVLKDKKLNLT